MKAVLAPLIFVWSVSLAGALSARDVNYKFSAGYKQVYTNGFVAESGQKLSSQQLNGVVASYGLAPDIHLGAYFGLERNFDAFILGPLFRYHFERLIYRNPSAWRYLNLFTDFGFFIKSGDDVETSLLIHAPSVGFEIFPFSEVDFAIETSAGLVIDLIEESMIGFTDGMFGDVGVRFYF